MEVSIKKFTVQPQAICFRSYKTFTTVHSSHFHKYPTCFEPATHSMLRQLTQRHAPHLASVSGIQLTSIYDHKVQQNNLLYRTPLLDFCYFSTRDLAENTQILCNLLHTPNVRQLTNCAKAVVELLAAI